MAEWYEDPDHDWFVQWHNDLIYEDDPVVFNTPSQTPQLGQWVPVSRTPAPADDASVVEDWDGDSRHSARSDPAPHPEQAEEPDQ